MPGNQHGHIWTHLHSTMASLASFQCLKQGTTEHVLDHPRNCTCVQGPVLPETLQRLRTRVMQGERVPVIHTVGFFAEEQRGGPGERFLRQLSALTGGTFQVRTPCYTPLCYTPPLLHHPLLHPPVLHHPVLHPPFATPPCATPPPVPHLPVLHPLCSALLAAATQCCRSHYGLCAVHMLKAGSLCCTSPAGHIADYALQLWGHPLAGCLTSSECSATCHCSVAFYRMHTCCRSLTGMTLHNDLVWDNTLCHWERRSTGQMYGGCGTMASGRSMT